jgi:hypothetical protein
MADAEIEKERLAIEHERLNLERSKLHIEREKLYLERYRVDVAPMENFDVEASRAAVSMAQMTIRTLILMNSGAVIVWPSLQKVFEGALTPSSLGHALSAHAFGIVAALIAAIFAFLSLHAGANRATAERNVRAMVRNKAHVEESPHVPKASGPTAEEIAREEALRKRRGRAALRHQYVGIAAAIISCAAFVAGAVIGGTSFALWIHDGWIRVRRKATAWAK